MGVTLSPLVYGHICRMQIRKCFDENFHIGFCFPPNNIKIIRFLLLLHLSPSLKLINTKNVTHVYNTTNLKIQFMSDIGKVLLWIYMHTRAMFYDIV